MYHKNDALYIQKIILSRLNFCEAFQTQENYNRLVVLFFLFKFSESRKLLKVDRGNMTKKKLKSYLNWQEKYLQKNNSAFGQKVFIPSPIFCSDCKPKFYKYFLSSAAHLTKEISAVFQYQNIFSYLTPQSAIKYLTYFLKYCS